jgi:hypothetical protein
LGTPRGASGRRDALATRIGAGADGPTGAFGAYSQQALRVPALGCVRGPAQPAERLDDGADADGPTGRAPSPRVPRGASARERERRPRHTKEVRDGDVVAGRRSGDGTGGL